MQWNRSTRGPGPRNVALMLGTRLFPKMVLILALAAADVPSKGCCGGGGHVTYTGPYGGSGTGAETGTAGSTTTTITITTTATTTTTTTTGTGGTGPADAGGE